MKSDSMELSLLVVNIDNGVSCSITYGLDHRSECYRIEHPEDEKFQKRGGAL